MTLFARTIGRFTAFAAAAFLICLTITASSDARGVSAHASAPTVAAVVPARTNSVENGARGEFSWLRTGGAYPSASLFKGISDNRGSRAISVFASSDLRALLDVTSGNPVQAGSNVTYRMVLVNQGPDDAQNVTFTDVLPAGTTFVSLTFGTTDRSNFSCSHPVAGNTGTITCTTALFSSFAFLQENIVNIFPVLKVDDAFTGTQLTNTVTGSSSNTPDPTPGNNSATTTITVTPMPDLTVTKTHSGSFAQGATGKTYSITAKNLGGAPTSGSVSVVDTLPAGLTATAMTGSGWACALGSLTCTRSDALASGASYPAITLTVSVSAGAPSSVTNTATVSGGGGDANTGNNQASDPTTITGVAFTVTRNDDRNNSTCAPGDCSLREAINAASAAAVAKTIQFSTLFDSPQRITLTNGQLVIGASMLIFGKGANLTTISANNASRVIYIPQGEKNVTISGLTIADGNATDGGGGGILNEITAFATVNLVDSAIINNNSAVDGGGLERGSGGIWNITGCTFAGNTAQRNGGGIDISSNETHITNTTISGNRARFGGAGIDASAGDLTVTNSTITGNTTLVSFAGNVGGLLASSGTAGIKNSIIAGNTGPNGQDVGGTFVSNGYNFIGKSDGSVGFTDGLNNDQVGTVAAPRNPLLVPLSNNGGPTQTHALAGNSPALDAGSATGPDQRGLTRPVDLAAYPNAAGGNAADIGSLEAQTAPSALADVTISKSHSGVFTQGESGKTYSIIVTNAGGSVTGGTVSVTDTLPAGLTATAITGTGWACTLGTLTCTRNDVLNAGTSYPAITLTVTVALNAPATVTNVANVSGGGEVNLANNQASDQTTIAVRVLPAIIVTRTDDRNNATCAVGDCSLREAIKAAIASAEVETIQFSSLFDSAQIITLTNGPLTLGKSMNIVGKGADRLTVSGNNVTRVFYIPSGPNNITISGLTIANGTTPNDGTGGGGMRNELSAFSTVNLINCAFVNNHSIWDGGGLDRGSGGTWNITGCTFSGNSAGVHGGAMTTPSNQTNITNTTISSNFAQFGGGGINNTFSNIVVTNTTITGNAPGNDGTVGGVLSTGGSATVKNTIIAGNNGVDAAGGFASNGYNLIGKGEGSSGFTNGVNGDQVGTNAQPINALLLPLANNGGRTSTHALSQGSPAVDKGSSIDPDQRGSTRPVDLPEYANAAGGNGADIGAFEAQSSPATLTDLTITKAHIGNFAQGDTGKTYSITVSNSGGTPTSGTVSVIDTLPAGLTATAMSGIGWSCNLATLTCTRTDALAGAGSYPAITLTVSVAANSPLAVTNIANVSGGGDSNLGNNQASDPTTITVATLADLTVTKTHAGNFVQGETGKTYSITVSNSGTASTSGTVSAVDTLPAGLTATALTGAGWSCTVGTLSCTRSDALPAGSSYPTIVLTVTVAIDAASSVTNTVSVSGGGETNTANDQASDPTTVAIAPLTVTRSDDRNDPTCVVGDCSLREAINAANTLPNKAIQFSSLFDSPQTIVLTNGELTIASSMTLAGKGADLVTISGNNTSRVLRIAQGNFTITISGLTIANGSAQDSGGGIRHEGGQAQINLTNLAFINNRSSIDGGGLYKSFGQFFNVTGCTFSGNVAQRGSAIFIESNSLNVSNTTISGNIAQFALGGGIHNRGTLTLTSSTITGNSSTSGAAPKVGGVFNSGTATIQNSIIAGNSGDSPDLNGSFTSAGYNFIGKSNGSTGFTDGINNDQVGTIASPKNPMLLALANYGGGTQTHKLSPGSPALDQGNATGPDQRGFTRPVDFAAYANAAGGNGADIGAFEAQVPTAAGVSVSGRILTSGGRGLTSAAVSITDANGNTLNTRTDRLGYFHFEGVEAGHAYVFSIMSRRYSFTPQVVMVTDDLTDLNFTADGAAR